jgi:hypothetical protein
VREKNAHTYFARNKERELPSSSPLLLLYLRPGVISDIPPSFTRTKRGPQNIYNNLCRASDAAVTPSPQIPQLASASSAYTKSTKLVGDFDFT